jgi:putative chitinase
MISFSQLIAGGIGATQARMFVDHINQVCEIYDIETPLRQAAFVAQCAHESALFTKTEEDLFYRDPTRIQAMFSAVRTPEQAASLVGKPEALANVGYANRNGNGDANSGDGYRFRGRGLIQLSGRNNYTAAALKLAEPYVDQPDLVAQAGDATLTAGWFWDRNGINRMADTGNIDDVTRAVNGSAMAGAVDRKNLFRVFFRIFTAPPAQQPQAG